MLAPFPPIEPTERGLLDVGDGQQVYWEVSGNPLGKPVIALHGGPGSGMSRTRGQYFDPAAYRLVQFDQRGCGRSTPPVADPATELTANTTHHLIADIERLRRHLGIERWLVWGASWGVTLALAYAQRFPERVTDMVLVSVTVTRAQDVRWLYHDAGRFFPAEWQNFRNGGGRADDLVAAYDQLLNGPTDSAVKERAARDWCAWEDAVLSLEEGWTPWDRFADPAFRMTFARLCAHYFVHAAWLGETELFDGVGRLADIPASLIHGRFDVGGPPDVAWALAAAWPAAELQLVRTGHSGGDEMTEAMLAALTRFRGVAS